MTTSYPSTVIDETGREWKWSDDWNGYRSEGMMTHGYDTIESQWGIRSVSRPPFLHYGLHPNLGCPVRTGKRITEEDDTLLFLTDY